MPEHCNLMHGSISICPDLISYLPRCYDFSRNFVKDKYYEILGINTEFIYVKLKLHFLFYCIFVIYASMSAIKYDI